jgi:3-oxoacyl-[acyl-carrier protein] reductase
MPTALITGASRGIGRAIARRLAASHEIVAVARSEPELDALADEITAAGGRCRSIALDVADADAVSTALAGLEADVVVNNAGVGVLKPFLELTLDDWRRMVDVNFSALYHVTRAVLPGMVSRERGHVVIIGSIAGRSAFVGGSCYAATKHAVMGFAESLMLEVRDAGVKVSVVSPGSVGDRLLAAEAARSALAAARRGRGGGGGARDRHAAGRARASDRGACALAQATARLSPARGGRDPGT